MGRASDALEEIRRRLGAVHGLSTRLQLGPVRTDADSSTYPQAGRDLDANTLAQGTHGRLRRWIMLRCVDWLPTGLHYVAELAFLYKQGSAPGMPVWDSPERHRFSGDKGSPHRPRMP